MNVVIIRRGKADSSEEIFDLLNKFFSGDIEGICKYVNIKEDDEILEGVRQMSGLGQAIYDDGVQMGMQQGIQQGMKQGIQQGIQGALVGLVRDGIIKLAEAAKRAHMSEDEFSKLLQDEKGDE